MRSSLFAAAAATILLFAADASADRDVTHEFQSAVNRGSIQRVVIDTRLFATSPSKKVSRSDSASYAQKRDREVPYGMKGGEH